MNSIAVSLSPHLEDFIQQAVNSGRYQCASEVVRTALQLLEEHERQKAAMLDWLAAEVHKGLDSGPGEPITPAFWHGLRDTLHRASAAGNDAVRGT